MASHLPHGRFSGISAIPAIRLSFDRCARSQRLATSSNARAAHGA